MIRFLDKVTLLWEVAGEIEFSKILCQELVWAKIRNR